ncbi:hypothetical protein [Thermosulfurimonas sp. F29]|uniref:hypothetical protein n=1 Tax=Thermosulfurimonas sp. F29 TaxID=2867247 RepID=UPI001C832BA7|nr:hypothetical protein [Thermosulfurimonas sp. F29]MBX6424159.1 hypothetical protein [Thermosulfurimonas sp. F29]
MSGRIKPCIGRSTTTWDGISYGFEPAKRQANEMVILAIDPGLRKSCGWAVLSYPSNVFQGDPPVLWARKTKLLACGVEDSGKLPRYVLASFFLRTARAHGVTEVLIEDFFFWTEKEESEIEKKTKGRKKGGKTGKGSILVVSRMKEFIGYLHGFFNAHLIPTTVVHPVRWKSILAKALKELPADLCSFPDDERRLAKKIEENLLMLFPEAAGYSPSKRIHIFSAIGLGLSRIIEATMPALEKQRGNRQERCDVVRLDPT